MDRQISPLRVTTRPSDQYQTNVALAAILWSGEDQAAAGNRTFGLLQFGYVDRYDIDATRQWYERVLGFKAGYTPDFKFPVCWLYLGERPVVHLVGLDEHDTSGLVGYLGDLDMESLVGSGAVDHVAFRATGAAELRQRLGRLGIPFRERSVPDLDLFQIFLEDPNEVTVELNYRGEGGD